MADRSAGVNMRDAILRMTADGYRIAIAGTSEVVSLIVSKPFKDGLHHHSVIVTRECIEDSAADALSMALTKCVESIEKQIDDGEHHG